jgi:hypothetical protein
MGWSDYFSGDVSVITVDGGHLGIFREPATAKTGEKLGTILETVNTELKTAVIKHDSRKENISSFNDKKIFDEILAAK